jgi:uncharacterized membrane protein SirB2
VTYQALKLLHLSCVLLSGIGFLLRGFWMLRESPLLVHRWVHVTPHLIDTALLGSAIFMALISSQYPFSQSWLTAKLWGLLAYILCGTMALKRGRTKSQRTAFFVLALCVYLYITSVALTRDPQAWLSRFF